MQYKSLLTVLTGTEAGLATLRSAVTLAEAWDSHVEGLCLGIDRAQVGYYYAEANALILQEALEQARTEAGEIRAAAERTFQEGTGRWSVEDAVCSFADIGRPVAYRARFADLVVLPQPYGSDRGAEAEPVVEAALFDGRTPVLVLPDGATVSARPKRIVAAWNESLESLVAIRAALPLLKTAETVRITVIDPPRHGIERSDPGGMLSQMLARHGVSCEIDVLAKSMSRVSDVLNRHALDTDADLMVMGAYGHSRFREAILGGATRNMLEQARVPVLMAH